MLTGVLLAAALVGNGVTAGIMLSTVIGIVPLIDRLPYERYVRTIQFLWPRYDPFMPITHGLTMLLDLALVVLDGDPARRALCGTAGAVLLVVMTISVLKNVPINRFVMAQDPQSPPAGWPRSDPRSRWRGWNRLRTGLALLALVVNAAAVTVG
ncbi:DUF1772 domain-containing protein [Amycolatopsis sp. NPDC021455]|uniref:DUF1772 domain-containing protein n=1 Tax=Amycolatopsis sp. NPDC021455 TaxID=3154901 RepID=UPI00340FCBB1